MTTSSNPSLSSARTVDQSVDVSAVHKVDIPPPVRIFLLFSAALTILSFLYSLVCRYLGLGLPYSFPYYYVPGDMFSDFFGFREKFSHWGTPLFFEHGREVGGYFMYPVPLVHIFHFFFLLPHSRTYFGLMLCVITALVTVLFYRLLRSEKLPRKSSLVLVASTILLSYPYLFVLQRWNIEILLALITGIAIWSYLRGHDIVAAIFIGVAASLKFYPFIFLGLFLPRRKYLCMAIGILSFVMTTLLALYGLGPTIAQAYQWDSEQIAAFSKIYVGQPWSIGYDHSFFALVKVLTMHWHLDYFALARPYSITIAIIAVSLYFLFIWRLPTANQVLALSVLGVTMAPISYDYTLLNLYPAFVMLIVIALHAERDGIAVPNMTAYMVLFTLVFTPQSYICFRGVRYGAEVRCLALIAILVLSLRKHLPDPELSVFGNLRSSNPEGSTIAGPA